MSKAKVFTISVDVAEAHLDENLHVNNVQYLQWVQDVAKAHWEKTAKTEWIERYVWVALSHHIEYKKPAFLNDQLNIKTHIEAFDGVKSTRLVRIYNQSKNELICQCATVWVMLDRKTNRPTRCLQEMAEAFFDPNE